MLDLFYVVLGFVILLLAGDLLVKGAVNLALRLGIPALLVSLTIVSFGTSAPELFISVGAILDGAPGIAMGNVVGSNTANVLLVLGIPAVLAGVQCAETDIKRSYFTMLAATCVFIGVCFLGPLFWAHGLLLLVLLAAILWDQAREARQHRADARNAAANGDDTEEVEGAEAGISGWKIAIYLVLGLIGLPFGAELLIDSAVSIATRFGVSETVIGLTLVAVGTSLPELSTTVMATLRNQSEVAIGNVIGSNMFNLLAIIGVATLFGAIPVDESLLTFDLWVMLGATLVLIPFVILRLNIGRLAGAGLSALYVTYVAFLLT